jgi:hypothetical protein
VTRQPPAMGCLICPENTGGVSFRDPEHTAPTTGET